MRRLVWAAVVLVVLGAGALLAFGLGFLPPSPPAPEMATVSPAAAANAEVKLVRLMDDDEEARLTDAELTSLFRYRPEIWTLGAVRSPEIEMIGDTLQLRGLVAAADLPARPDVDALRLFLPDTAEVVVSGTVRRLDEETTILDVASVEVAGMPVPERLYQQVLETLGQGEEKELPASAFALPLPDGIRSVRIEDGELVLTP